MKKNFFLSSKRKIKSILDIKKQVELIYNYKKYNREYKYHTIYIVAGNRSASTWLRDLLTHIFVGYNSYHPQNHPSGREGDNYDITLDTINEYKKRLYVSRSHTPPKKSNIEIMDKYFKKYLLTIRDPRDVLTSLYLHLKEKKPLGSAFVDQGLDRELPWKVIDKDFYKLNKKDLISQLISKVMPGVIEIMEKWLDYSLENKNIMVIKYEKLINDPVEEVLKISKFYEKEIKKSKIIKAVEDLNPRQKNSKFNYFFIGKTGIWKDYLDSQEINEIEDLSRSFMLKANYKIN